MAVAFKTAAIDRSAIPPRQITAGIRAPHENRPVLRACVTGCVTTCTGFSQHSAILASYLRLLPCGRHVASCSPDFPPTAFWATLDPEEGAPASGEGAAETLRPEGARARNEVCRLLSSQWSQVGEQTTGYADTVRVRRIGERCSREWLLSNTRAVRSIHPSSVSSARSLAPRVERGEHSPLGDLVSNCRNAAFDSRGCSPHRGGHRDRRRCVEARGEGSHCRPRRRSSGYDERGHGSRPRRLADAPSGDTRDHQQRWVLAVKLSNAVAE